MRNIAGCLRFTYQPRPTIKEFAFVADIRSWVGLYPKDSGWFLVFHSSQCFGFLLIGFSSRHAGSSAVWQGTIGLRPDHNPLVCVARELLKTKRNRRA